jgi:hypothetical protein
MKSYFQVVLMVFLCCAAPQVQAQELTLPAPVKLLVGGALEFGGDKVGQIYTDEGGSQIIRGAQGVSLVAGAQLRFPSFDRFMLHATVGYKYFRTMTDGAHVRLSRIPIHLTAHYFVTKDVRLGAGVLTDRNIKFNGDGLGANASYDPSFGIKLEVGWRNLAFGYTIMDYTRKNDRERCAGGIGLTYLRTVSWK